MKEHVWINSRNKRLSAMLHLPENFTPGTPLIVCCHGFTGNKVGYNNLTSNLANFLETSGYAVLRFDFLGSGDSEGDFATDTIVSGWKEDLVNVVGWVKTHSQLSASEIFLYGHSLGGLIVLTHQDFAKVIAGRIVFAPVTNPIQNFRDIIIGQKLWYRSLEGEAIENFFDKGFTLESQFVLDLVKNDYQPVAAAAKLSTPLLVVHGKADTVVPLEGSRNLIGHYLGDREFVITEFDHGALGAQPELQTVIGTWLTEHAVINSTLG